MAYGSKMKFRTAAVGESSAEVATNRLPIFDGERCISSYFATVVQFSVQKLDGSEVIGSVLMLDNTSFPRNFET